MYNSHRHSVIAYSAAVGYHHRSRCTVLQRLCVAARGRRFFVFGSFRQNASQICRQDYERGRQNALGNLRQFEKRRHGSVDHAKLVRSIRRTEFLQSSVRRTGSPDCMLLLGVFSHRLVVVKICFPLQENKSRRVIVFVEKIFRGTRYKEPVEIFSVSYKPDYRLIPKDEEKLWWERLANCKPRVNVVPGSIKLPPLMKASVLLTLFYTILISNKCYIIIIFPQLILERDNKDVNTVLPLEIRSGRDNVAQTDVTKFVSYKPIFYKNQSS